MSSTTQQNTTAPKNNLLDDPNLREELDVIRGKTANGTKWKNVRQKSSSKYYKSPIQNLSLEEIEARRKEDNEIRDFNRQSREEVKKEKEDHIRAIQQRRQAKLEKLWKERALKQSKLGKKKKGKNKMLSEKEKKELRAKVKYHFNVKEVT